MDKIQRNKAPAKLPPVIRVRCVVCDDNEDLTEGKIYDAFTKRIQGINTLMINDDAGNNKHYRLKGSERVEWSMIGNYAIYQ